MEEETKLTGWLPTWRNDLISSTETKSSGTFLPLQINETQQKQDKFVSSYNCNYLRVAKLQGRNCSIVSIFPLTLEMLVQLKV